MVGVALRVDVEVTPGDADQVYLLLGAVVSAMLAPTDRVVEIVDTICVESEQHRQLHVAMTVVSMTVAALTPAGGFISMAATGSAIVAGSGAGVGYVSRWRGWTDTE